MVIAERFAAALKSHRENKLPDVEKLCLETLEECPDEPNSLNLLSTVYRQQGHRPAAVRFAERAVERRPNSAFFLFNLGDAYRSVGYLETAVDAYERSIAIEPHPQAFTALGIACVGLDRIAQAADAFTQAIRLDPRHLATYRRLYDCQMLSGRFTNAATTCRQALALRPTDARFHFALGQALGRLCRWLDAAEAYRRASTLAPAQFVAHTAHCDALKQCGKFREAADAARSALAIDPNNVQAHLDLAALLAELGQLTQAATECQRALDLKPSDLPATATLARLEFQRLDHAKGMELLRRALELSNGSPRLASGVLMCQAYAPDVDEKNLFEAHRRWGAAIASQTPRRDLDIQPDPDRPLRIGYVSPDFRGHSVSRFFEPILARHDRSQFSAVLFSDTQFPDDATARLRRLVSAWHDTRPLDYAQLGDLIEREKIDILVDLSGHTADNRLPTFASRPAPVQITYLGYPNTTGLPLEVMQYRVTDAVCDPLGAADELHTERLLRLPRTFICYQPQPDAPPVSQPPETDTGFVTFGSFNSIFKCSQSLFELWAGVLRRVPKSKLMLKNTAMDDPDICGDIAQRFAALDVSSDRLVLVGPQRSVSDHLAQYAQVDIALDTYPYNGTTTTCEALWMGVPVVTLAGVSHRSRVGASILQSLDLPELICASQDECVAVTASLASDPARRQSLRRSLRTTMASSPLSDALNFVTELQRIYRDVWRGFCQRRPSESLPGVPFTEPGGLPPF